MNPTRTGLLAAFGLLLSAGSGLAEDPASITVVSWGDAYTKAQAEAIYKPWMKETGNRLVSVDYSGGLKEIGKQIKDKKVTWNLIDVERADAEKGCAEGLFEPIDPAILPPAPDGTAASADFLPGALMACAVGNVVWSTVLVFDKSKIEAGAAAPKTAADFFDLEKFPGKRGLRRDARETLELALFADGVAPADIYTELATPKGQDRAFAKLETIKGEIVWWKDGDDALDLVTGGRVAMSTALNGPVFAAIVAEEKPLSVIWDGQLYNMDYWAIPKGAPKKELTLKFLAYASAPERLASQASWMAFGPARKSAQAMIGNHATLTDVPMAKHIPTVPENFATAIAYDYKFWLDNGKELDKQFRDWQRGRRQPLVVPTPTKAPDDGTAGTDGGAATGTDAGTGTGTGTGTDAGAGVSTGAGAAPTTGDGG